MTTTLINQITEIHHFDHDAWCVIEQETSGGPMEVVVDIEDIPKIIETLAATMITQRG